MRVTKRERARKILSQIKELYTFLNCDDEFEQAFSDMEKMDKVEQNLEHIDIAIRCAMCTNPMKSNRGCDGGCRVDEEMYKKVLGVINKEIEQIVKE